MDNQVFSKGIQLPHPHGGGTAMFRPSSQQLFSQPRNHENNVVPNSEYQQSINSKQGNPNLNYYTYSKIESMEKQLAELVNLYHNLYYLCVMNNNNNPSQQTHTQNNLQDRNNENRTNNARNYEMTSYKSTVPLTQTLQDRRFNMQNSSVVDEIRRDRVPEHDDGWRMKPASHGKRSKQTLTFNKPPVSTRNRFEIFKEQTFRDEFPRINTSQRIQLASNIKIIRGNLFSAPFDCALVHCVAADFLCGRGIATQFKKLFGNLENMINQLRRPGQVAVDTRSSDEWKYIFHLVTKEMSTQKPELKDIISSLCELRQCCHILKIKKIALPKIACGRDHMKWECILQEINSIFGDTGIDVTIYTATRSDVKSFSRAAQATRQTNPSSGPQQNGSPSSVSQGLTSPPRSGRTTSVTPKRALLVCSPDAEMHEEAKKNSGRDEIVLTTSTMEREVERSRQAAMDIPSLSSTTSLVSLTTSGSPDGEVVVKSDTPASGVDGPPFRSQKEDLIAELKRSRDISGIRKIRVERARSEERQEKERFTKLSKQFSVENFVEQPDGQPWCAQIPATDATGNPIPAWKRQMLAKKAAERARKEAEERAQREAEEQRMRNIPPWKRALMAQRKDGVPETKRSADITCNGVYPTRLLPESPPSESLASSIAPESVVSVVVPTPTPAPAPPTPEICENNKENSQPPPSPSPKFAAAEESVAATPIMPWRAQLRKTNSTLNLLE